MNAFVTLVSVAQVQAEALRRTAKQSVIVAVTMIFITGIMWIFGYIVLISDDVTYVTLTSWIFAICGSLQVTCRFCSAETNISLQYCFEVNSGKTGYHSVRFFS